MQDTVFDPFSDRFFVGRYRDELQHHLEGRTMKKFHRTGCIGLLAGLLIMSGCAYVNIKSPLDKDVNRTELGSKVGISSSQSVLWLFAWGDAGTEAAARNGGITTITHLDAAYRSYLFGLYSERETIAYGD